MTFLDFAKQISPIPLMEWQKRYFEEIDKIGVHNVGQIQLFGRRSKKALACKILSEYIKYREILGLKENL